MLETSSARSIFIHGSSELSALLIFYWTRYCKVDGRERIPLGRLVAKLIRAVVQWQQSKQ